MSALTSTRDYCRRMANGAHTTDCQASRPGEWRSAWTRTVTDEEARAAIRGEVPFPEPPCTCATAADRAGFRRLADEIDAYLAGDPDVISPPTDDDQPLEGL